MESNEDDGTSYKTFNTALFINYSDDFNLIVKLNKIYNYYSSCNNNNNYNNINNILCIYRYIHNQQF